MKDFLLTGSFILFILGMGLLLGLYYFADISDYTISEITSSDVTYFTTSGYVREVQDRGSVIFITLEEQCSLLGMAFSDGSTNFDAFEHSFVIISGHTSTYNDEKTYIFDEIRKG